MYDLKGKTAIVTGGTRGLGRAISLNLARLGATVAMNYRRDDASAERTLADVRAIAPRSLLAKADLEARARWVRTKPSRVLAIAASLLCGEFRRASIRSAVIHVMLPRAPRLP